MASENIHLYDDVKADWFKIILESDLNDLVSAMDNNELQLIPSEQGSRGLRYFNNKLEYSTDNGTTWNEIQTGGGASLPISANDVTDTTSRVLVSPTQRAQIDSNSSDITSHSQRIHTLENSIGSMTTTDENVKMNVTDTSGYLEDKLDNTTVQNVGNKIVAKGLDGLTATITELNLLSGVTSNIQAQINALTSVGNFTTSVDTYANLATLTPNVNDMVIVIADETQVNSPTVIYIYNGTTWVYSGKFEGGQIRDFTTNPLNLDTESTGILPKSKYEKQNASETPITDASGNLTATNVEDALSELFTYANNIKSIANVIGSPLSTSDTSTQLNNKMQKLKVLFANYLTQKGVIAYPYNTFEEMINKVLVIPNVTLNGTIKSTTKFNIIAPYQQQIILNEPLRLEDIATTVLKHVSGISGVVHYTVEYNNGESSSFDYNPDEIILDGYMHIKDSYDYNLTGIETDYYESDTIDFANDFIEYGGNLTVDIDTLKLTVKGLKYTSAIVKANGDISLAGIDSLNQVTLTSILNGNGLVRMLTSFDSGLTWYSWDGTQWNTVDVNDKNDFKINGMDVNVFNSLTNTELSILRGESNFIRFAYYLEQPAYSDVAKNDKIELKVTTQGYNVIADNSDFNYSYDMTTKTLTYNFLVDGTYTMTYVDV